MGQEVPDEMLTARYADAEAFSELLPRYESHACEYFVKQTGSPTRAENLYQALFLYIHQARDACDPTRPFAQWLFQIAHRLLIDDARRAFRSRVTG